MHGQVQMAARRCSRGSMATLFHDRISGRRGWLPGGFGTTVVQLGSWTFQAEISRPEGGAALRALQFFADAYTMPPRSDAYRI